MPPPGRGCGGSRAARWTAPEGRVTFVEDTGREAGVDGLLGGRGGGPLAPGAGGRGGGRRGTEYKVGGGGAMGGWGVRH